MASIAGVVLVAVVLAACSINCSAAPRYDDDGKVAVDRDGLRDLAGPLLQILRATGELGPMCHHKRNSEIINSLLGLPKTMTEAGRK